MVSVDLLPECQSGFRADHSCTTALLHICDDTIKAKDKGNLTLLILLDYSKAFDTVNHQILLSILHCIGLEQSACILIQSCLSNRVQRVQVNGTISQPLQLSSGVSQGSILGLLLYTIYTFHFSKMLVDCSCHFYADDTQLYLSFPKDQLNIALERIERDVERLVSFSKAHCLSINSSKSKCLLFGNLKDREQIQNSVSLYVDDISIGLVKEARNLGLTMDVDLKFKTHVNNMLRMAYANLQLLYKNKDFLNRPLRIMLTI